MTILIPGTYMGSASSSAWTETFEANIPPGFTAYGIAQEIPGSHRFEVYIDGQLSQVFGDVNNPNPYLNNLPSNAFGDAWIETGSTSGSLRVIATTNPGYPESRYGVSWTGQDAGQPWVYDFPGSAPVWRKVDQLQGGWWYTADGGVAEAYAMQGDPRYGVYDDMRYDNLVITKDVFGWADGFQAERGYRICQPMVYHDPAMQTASAGVVNGSQMTGAGGGAFAHYGNPQIAVYRVKYDPLYYNPRIDLQSQSNLFWQLDDGYTSQLNLVWGQQIRLEDTRVAYPVTADNSYPGNTNGPIWGGINYYSKGTFDQLWFGSSGAIALNYPNPLTGALKIYVGPGEGKYDNNGWDIITNSSPNGDWYGYRNDVNSRQFKMWNGVTWSYGTDIELVAPGATRTDPYQPNPGVSAKPFYVETDSGFVVSAWMLPMGPESDPYNYNTPASILPDPGGFVNYDTGMPSDGTAVVAPTNYGETGGGPDIGGGGTGGTGGGAGGTVTVGTDPSATGHAGNIYNPWSGYSITGSWQDHMSYSLGGIDYPLGYGTPIAAPASGTLHTSGGSGDYATGWVGSAGRRSILYLDTPMPRVNPNLEQKEGSGPMVAIVFQHQSAFGTNGKHYGKGEFCGMSGASANGQNYGGDVHLHVHGLNAGGQRLDLLNYV